MGKDDLQWNKSKKIRLNKRKMRMKIRKQFLHASVLYNPSGELVPWWEVTVCSYSTAHRITHRSEGAQAIWCQISSLSQPSWVTLGMSAHISLQTNVSDQILFQLPPTLFKSKQKVSSSFECLLKKSLNGADALRQIQALAHVVWMAEAQVGPWVLKPGLPWWYP